MQLPSSRPVRQGRYASATLLGTSAAVAAFLVSPPAYATSNTPCACLTRRVEAPTVGASNFSADTMDSFKGSSSVGGGTTGAAGYQPIVIRNPDGSIRTAILDYQLVQSFGASYVWNDWLRPYVSVPFVWSFGSGGRLNNTVFPSPPWHPVVGDVRVGADAKILGGGRKAPHKLAVGLAMSMPTGSPETYSGSGLWKFAPQVLYGASIGGSNRDDMRLKLAFRLGAGFYPQDRPGPSQAVGGMVLGFQPVRAFTFTLEGSANTDVTEASRVLDPTTSPLEVLVGTYFRARNYRLSVAAGTGTQAIGAPTTRFMFGIEFLGSTLERPAPAKDSDGDGVPDERDACPRVAGERSLDPAANGCPVGPEDHDSDGISDDDDACPTVPGVASKVKGKNGCPADADDDGVPDAVDACPKVPGSPNENPKLNGCQTDRDHDGINDDLDACPDNPGIPSPDPRLHGCPAIKKALEELRKMPAIGFRLGETRLPPEANAGMNQLLDILEKNPELLLRVEGHTDNEGNPSRNLKVSELRVQSIKDWLIAHGIDSDRISVEGYGDTRPIADNKTVAGRAKNRRVEMTLAPVPNQTD